MWLCEAQWNSNMVHNLRCMQFILVEAFFHSYLQFIQQDSAGCILRVCAGDHTASAYQLYIGEVHMCCAYEFVDFSWVYCVYSTQFRLGPLLFVYIAYKQILHVVVPVLAWSGILQLLLLYTQIQSYMSIDTKKHLLNVNSHRRQDEEQSSLMLGFVDFSFLGKETLVEFIPMNQFAKKQTDRAKQGIVCCLIS